MVCVVFVCFCEMFGDHAGVYCCEVGFYVLFYNGFWVCADVCCLSNVVECDLFLESGSVSVYC